MTIKYDAALDDNYKCNDDDNDDKDNFDDDHFGCSEFITGVRTMTMTVTMMMVMIMMMVMNVSVTVVFMLRMMLKVWMGKHVQCRAIECSRDRSLWDWFGDQGKGGGGCY